MNALVFACREYIIAPPSSGHIRRFIQPGSPVMSFPTVQEAWDWLCVPYDPNIFDYETALFGVVALPGKEISAESHVGILVDISKKERAGQQKPWTNFSDYCIT